MIKLLLVDDEEMSREMVGNVLEGLLPVEIDHADSGAAALSLINNKHYDLVISDIRMPGMNGNQLLKEIKNLPKERRVEVVLLTGYADLDSALSAFHDGAYDYLLKPVDITKITDIIKRREAEIKASAGLAPDRKKQSPTASDIITINGKHQAGFFSKEMKILAENALKLHEERNIPVLIVGEIGSGKELIASLIHYGCNGADRPFIKVNCSNSDSIERDLFGTGIADCRNMSRIELADKGTLYLDNITELPLDLQSKLAEIIKEKRLIISGSKEIRDLDVRYIASATEDPKALLNKSFKEDPKVLLNKSFKENLYYELSTSLFVPPLREQPEAVVPLAQLLINESCERRNRQLKRITPEAAEMLKEYHWYGNVLELRNAAERIALLYSDAEVSREHLLFLTANSLKSNQLPILDPDNFILPENGLNIKEFEKKLVSKALKKFNNNKTKTAEYLGITLSALRSRM